MNTLLTHGPDLLFYLFALTAVAAAVVVVRARNPMYSAIGLLVNFLALAGLFLLLRAEFLAAVQIFVYGGGVMVLFLFVIMLVRLHDLSDVRMFNGNVVMAVILALVLVALLVFVVTGAVLAPATDSPPAFVDVEGEALGNSQAVAWLLYRNYLLPFEIASVFLLIAMIGAVVLGRRV